MHADVNGFSSRQGHLNVAQSTTSRRYGEFFLRHGQKFADVYENLHAKPFPVPKKKDNGNGVPAQVATGGAAGSKAAGSSSASGGAWAKAAKA